MDQQQQRSPQEQFNQALFNAITNQRNQAQNQLAEKDAVIQMQQMELNMAHARIAELTNLAKDNGIDASANVPTPTGADVSDTQSPQAA